MLDSLILLLTSSSIVFHNFDRCSSITVQMNRLGLSGHEDYHQHKDEEVKCPMFVNELSITSGELAKVVYCY